jgi:predicted ester cyclase
VTPDELRAWYEDYLDVCNRHDLEGIRERLAPDVRRAGEASGADSWVRDIEALLGAFPDYRWKRIAVLVEGDRLAAHLRTRGTHRGAFRGVRPTGRHVSVAEFAFYRIVGGRIVEYAGTADDAGLVAQLTR